MEETVKEVHLLGGFPEGNSSDEKNPDGDRGPMADTFGGFDSAAVTNEGLDKTELIETPSNGGTSSHRSLDATAENRQLAPGQMDESDGAAFGSNESNEGHGSDEDFGGFNEATSAQSSNNLVDSVSDSGAKGTLSGQSDLPTNSTDASGGLEVTDTAAGANETRDLSSVRNEDKNDAGGNSDEEAVKSKIVDDAGESMEVNDVDPIPGSADAQIEGSFDSADFGGFHDVPPASQEVNEEVRDGLCSLDSGVAEPSPTPQDVERVQDEEFSDFTGEHADKEAVSANQAICDDDGFGDFGTAGNGDGIKDSPSSAKPSVNGGTGDHVCASDVGNLDQPNDRDDSGDFDGALTESRTSNAVVENLGEKKGSSSTLDGEQRATGVLDTAKGTAVATNLAASSDEDEFGDFGDFDSAPHNSGGVTTVTDVAPQAPTAIDGTGDTAAKEGPIDDDDFGDFDAAPEARSGGFDAENTPTAQPPAPSDGDEFGEFGDFDSAPPAATAESGNTGAQVSDDEEDFGDFGGADNEVADPGSSASGPPDSRPQISSTGDLDSLPTRAKSKFKFLFAQYAPAGGGEDEDDDSPSHGEATVERILSSVIDRAQENKNGRIESKGTSKVVLEVLEDAGKFDKIPPHSIISSGAKGAYSHFSFPVNGVETMFANTSASQGRKRIAKPKTEAEPSHSSVAEPTISEEKAHNPEPAVDSTTSKPENNRPILAETVVALPPVTTNDTGTTSTKEKLPAPTRENGQQSSDRFKEFLKQIPDLSFMLSPKLTLPRGAGST